MTTSHPTFPACSVEDAQKEVAVSVIKYGDDPDQVLEFYGESNLDTPTLVLIHGGYWRNLFDREHMRPLAVALAQEGYLVVLPEFRRVAGEPETTLRDLAFAISTLEDSTITLIGYSSGGHLALLLGDKFPNVKKVIGLAPVTDLIESQRLGLGREAVAEWLGVDATLRPELDPMVRPAPTSELHFIHGDQDERVPLELSKKYVAVMKEQQKSVALNVLEGVSHFQMMEVPSPTYSAILAAIN
ncbi:MAG: alpha/beta hydrolase family protein [Candidatus Planktophila sp.]